jgi:AP-4 complex subunit sigma-1
VCELDIMFHLDRAHFILDEMVMNGCIVETNRTKVLSPVQVLDSLPPPGAKGGKA